MSRQGEEAKNMFSCARLRPFLLSLIVNNKRMLLTTSTPASLLPMLMNKKTCREICAEFVKHVLLPSGESLSLLNSTSSLLLLPLAFHKQTSSSAVDAMKNGNGGKKSFRLAKPDAGHEFEFPLEK